jgi:hypothetical protein
MDTRIIDRTISDIRSGKTNSLRILHSAARPSHELVGTNWGTRPSQAKGSREEIMERSVQTLEQLRPALDRIKRQVPGFQWRRDTYSEPATGVARYVRLDLELGKRDYSRSEWTWRGAAVDIAGKNVKVSVYGCAYDEPRNFDEGLRLDGALFSVRGHGNPSALDRTAEYIAALAVEGRASDLHWNREDYEDRYKAKIRTSRWGFGRRLGDLKVA